MKRTALWRIREKFQHEKRPLLKEAFNQVTPSSSSKFVYSLRSLLSKYTHKIKTLLWKNQILLLLSVPQTYAARILQRKQKNPFILICNVPVLGRYYVRVWWLRNCKNNRCKNVLLQEFSSIRKHLVNLTALISIFCPKKIDEILLLLTNRSI